MLQKTNSYTSPDIVFIGIGGVDIICTSPVNANIDDLGDEEDYILFK